MFVLVGSVNAQQNLAQEAYAIFEQSCLICHGKNGLFSDDLLIEHTVLIENGSVVPEDPDASVFYQRLIETNLAKRMPLGQPQLDPAAIETIRQWILAGAPDWSDISRPETNFITTDTVLQTIENHVMMIWTRQSSNQVQYDVFCWSSDLEYAPTDEDYENAEVASLPFHPKGLLTTTWGDLKNR